MKLSYLMETIKCERSMKTSLGSPTVMTHMRAIRVRKCFAHHMVWRCTCDDRTQVIARTAAPHAEKRSVITWALRNTGRHIQPSKYSNARRAGNISSAHPRYLRTCWYTPISGLFLVITAGRDSIRSRTWKSICSFTQARSPISVASAASASVSPLISLLIAVSIWDLNLSLVQHAVELSIVK